MSKAVRISVNLGTDTGATFSGGSILLEADMAGEAGLIVNGMATGFAVLLRLRAELQKGVTNDNDAEHMPNMLDDPRTATLAAAVSQALIAGFAMSTAMKNGSGFLGAVVAAAIPILFAVGSMAAGGLFERTAVGIRKLLKQKTELSVPEKIVTGSEPYYTSGDFVAAGPALPFVAPFFAAAVVGSLHANITGRPAPDWRNPFVLFAGASLLTAGLNIGAPLVAGAFALYTVGYLSIGAVQRYGGVYEAGAAMKSRPL